MCEKAAEFSPVRVPADEADGFALIGEGVIKPDKKARAAEGIVVVFRMLAFERFLVVHPIGDGGMTTSRRELVELLLSLFCQGFVEGEAGNFTRVKSGRYFRRKQKAK